MSSSTETEGLAIDNETLAGWPGLERREPRRSDRHYLVLSSLAEQIRAVVDTRLADGRMVRVLDVGCGDKPYLPLFAERASSYRGLDRAAGPLVDDIGSAESLPYDQSSFDLVLCTQVLEHADDPSEVVREIFRVLAPGGLALVSTHGVFLYHPDPPESDRDYWRWTHSGLAKLFRECADWSAVEVRPNRNAVACLGYVLAQFVDEGARRRLPRGIGAGLTTTINSVAEWLDRRYPTRARVPRPGSLAANYLVVAEKR